MKKRIIFALVITLTSISALLLGGGITYFSLFAYIGKSSFNDPAYDLPLGTHFNTVLDNETIVNQTILEGLETALWTFTRLQRSGGFPLGSKEDGSLMWSDRGPKYPLFPREFSIQEGTPMVGGVFLSMYQIEPNPIYLNVAKEVGDALLAIQDKNGGFYYDGRRHKDGSGWDPNPWNIRKSTILDDNVMQSSMSYLLDIYNITGNGKYLEGFHKAMNCLNSIELPYGGWKQRSNFPNDAYQSQSTLNDNAFHDVVMMLLKAHSMFPANSTYLETARRAGDFLISTQGNGGSSFQRGWAQQYDSNFQPCWARDFEPPAICSMQTASSIRVLIELYLVTNETKWLDPIPDAITWLNSSETKLDEDTWARLYELDTNVPIYGIENGKNKNPQYVYDVEEARSGYTWQYSFGVPETINSYQKLVNLLYSISDFIEWGSLLPSIESLEQTALNLVQQLNPSGFWVDTDAPWIDEGQIISQTFAYKTNLIFLYMTKALEQM